MTAKEKVLKVWPNAKSYKGLNFHMWAIFSLGYCKGEPLAGGDSEEAAWQNAAESLPQPAQECDCPSDGLGPLCDYCCNKPPKTTAEPKPTLPEPVASEDQECKFCPQLKSAHEPDGSCYNILTSAKFEPRQSSLTSIPAQPEQLVSDKELFAALNYFAKIPVVHDLLDELQEWRKLKRPENGLPDPSIPAQTFEEWWETRKKYLTFSDNELVHFAACAREAWNAAKGSK